MQVFITTLSTALALTPQGFERKVEGEERFVGKRQRTFRAGRELLLTVFDKFYGPQQKLPSMFYGEHGKPYFVQSPRFFNLSHSGDYLALSVGDVEQGLDLEVCKPRKMLDEIIKKNLSLGEIDYLLAKDEAQKVKEFGLFWTLRESLIKESGLGLVGLSKIKVNLQAFKVSCEDNSQGQVFSYYLPHLLENVANEVKPSWLSFFVNQKLLLQNPLPFEIYTLSLKAQKAGAIEFTKLDASLYKSVFKINL